MAVSVTLTALVLFAAADVPCHCELDDWTNKATPAGSSLAEKGGNGLSTWVFTTTPPVPLGSSLSHKGVQLVPEDFHNNEKNCGLGAPNTNSENVEFMRNGGLQSLMEGMPDTETFKIQLKPERVLQGPAPHKNNLVAECADENCKSMFQPAEGLMHTWTPAYDEGLEVSMMDGDMKASYLMLSEYSCDAANKDCGKIGAGEEPDGKTIGYHSICGRSLVGWYNKQIKDADGSLVEARGCFHAQKEDPESANERHSVTMADRSSFAQTGESEVHTVYHKTDFAHTLLEHEKTDTGALNFQLMTFNDFLTHHNEAAAAGHASFTTVKQASKNLVRRFSSKTKMRLRGACDATETIYGSLLEEMPKTFNWDSHYDGAWKNPVVDQGSCGSCYGVSILSSLEDRANLHFFRALDDAGVPKEHWPEKAPVKLSVDAHLECNSQDQGCSGGYPFTSASWIAQNGVPSEASHPTTGSPRGEVNKCPKEAFEDPSNVMFAQNNYAYNVGSYGSTCGDVYLMKAIAEQGPNTVALEVTPPFSSAGSDRAIVGESFLQTGRVGAATPADHNVHTITEGASFIEAKYQIKHECKLSHSQDEGFQRMREGLSELIPDSRDWFSMTDHNTIVMDSDKVPEDMNPHMEMVQAAAAAQEVDPSCVHVDIGPMADIRWQHTNHAVKANGWGEVVVHDHSSFAETGKTTERVHKYWIIQNSWGAGYGEGGVSYVARGVNYAGLEHQGVDIRPKWDVGMMASLLEPYQQYVPEGKELKYRPHPKVLEDKDDPPMPMQAEDTSSSFGSLWAGFPLLQTHNQTNYADPLFANDSDAGLGDLFGRNLETIPRPEMKPLVFSMHNRSFESSHDQEVDKLIEEMAQNRTKAATPENNARIDALIEKMAQGSMAQIDKSYGVREHVEEKIPMVRNPTKMSKENVLKKAANARSGDSVIA